MPPRRPSNTPPPRRIETHSLPPAPGERARKRLWRVSGALVAAAVAAAVAWVMSGERKEIKVQPEKPRSIATVTVPPPQQGATDAGAKLDAQISNAAPAEDVNAKFQDIMGRVRSELDARCDALTSAYENGSPESLVKAFRDFLSAMHIDDVGNAHDIFFRLNEQCGLDRSEVLRILKYGIDARDGSIGAMVDSAIGAQCLEEAEQRVDRSSIDFTDCLVNSGSDEQSKCYAEVNEKASACLKKGDRAPEECFDLEARSRCALVQVSNPAQLTQVCMMQKEKAALAPYIDTCRKQAAVNLDIDFDEMQRLVGKKMALRFLDLQDKIINRKGVTLENLNEYSGILNRAVLYTDNPFFWSELGVEGAEDFVQGYVEPAMKVLQTHPIFTSEVMSLQRAAGLLKAK